MTHPHFPPETLRQYALLADGERGALVGPRGNIAFLCAPRWHDDAVFSALLGGPGRYAITPANDRYVWGGHYEQDTLIWRSHWVTTGSVIESREALAFPGEAARVVLLRRVEAVLGDAHVRVELECRAGFGAHVMTVRRSADGTWEGRTGDLRYRWSGVPTHARLLDGCLVLELTVPEGQAHDLVLEICRTSLPTRPPDPARAWAATQSAWSRALPHLGASAAPGESAHSYAVLRGLTSAAGGMVAAATTSLPERADTGRDYDYRYAWIRDQCYAGQAAATAGADDLLDAAVRFVTDRVHQDGGHLKPAYTVDGGRVPDERQVSLPGYPGAPVRIGNHVNDQFQLDALGEALMLLAAADRADRMDSRSHAAIDLLVSAIEDHWDSPDSGIWELERRRWAHSRLMCAAGLRAIAAPGSHPSVSSRALRSRSADLDKLAQRLVESVDQDCLHPSGRWQRSPGDPAVDAALLLPGLRGAVPSDDPRHTRTLAAVIEDLADDGYVYRFRQEPSRSLHGAEGAFVLSGFHLSLALLQQGRRLEAVRWFERNRSALGPPGLFAEEFDVVQRQLRGNLPQAFVHAVALEAAQRLGQAEIGCTGFEAHDR